MKVFPTAQEARKKASTIITENDQFQAEEVFEFINNAISKGEYTMTFYSALRNNVKELLKTLGYKIEDQSNQRDGSQFKISW